MCDDSLPTGAGWPELQRLLDAGTLRRLRPHLTHTGLDGRPCVERDRLHDLLRLLDQEDYP